MVKKWFWACPEVVPKKWSKNGFGLAPEGSPGDAQKMVEKWSKNGPLRSPTIFRPLFDPILDTAALYFVSRMVKK